MSDSAFTELQKSFQSGGATAAFDRLSTELRERKLYHKLFDAICLKKKHELGAPLQRPTSFDDIPEAKRDEFEATYVNAARQIGRMLLDDGKLGQAYVYFHAVRETEPVKAAIDAIPVPEESTEQSEELIDLAFYKLVHPVKGMQILLKTHGTCNTITSLDQLFAGMTAEQRADCAALLVRTLHTDLSHSVERDIKHRTPGSETASTLEGMTSGRDFLFADNNYHIDVSHLHSTVRLARSLRPDQPELALVRDLAIYGQQLSPQFKYPGEVPFVDFYPAHLQLFNFLLNQNRDEALAYFQSQLDASEDAQDRAMIAYVMVDLLARTDRLDEAVALAEKHLIDADGEFFGAFAELCQKAGRLDVLRRCAEQRSDFVTFVAALVQ